MHRHALTDDEWVRLEPLLPPERGRPGRPPTLLNRLFVDGVVYIAKTGLPWRDLPGRFGPWKSVFNKWSRWNKKGVFSKVFDVFAQDADNEASIADSTYARAHQHSAGGKGGSKISALDDHEAVSRRRFTPWWTASEIQPTSTSRPAMSTMLSRHPSSSRRQKARTSSPIKRTMPTMSSGPPRRKG